MKTAVLTISLLLASLGLGQAQPESKSAAPDAPAAHSSDVKSVDSILNALYDVISGPAGQKRDWNRFRSLFAPGAHLIPVSPKPDKSGYAPRVLTVEEFISRVDPFTEKEGFYETGIANRVDQWAQIVQVFSTYESRHAKGEKPFVRGINSFQLYNDGQRWWVLNILWESESEQNPLPERMLKPPGGKAQ